VNLSCVDPARYHDLPTHWILCIGELSYCLGGGNKTMSLPIMADPDQLLVGDSKVDTCD
jgi:hypothetical protein